MIWLSTVWPERGPMCQRRANSARPSSMVPRITPRSNSVRLARMARGSLNSGTPLAMASTPVSALHPAENAYRLQAVCTEQGSPGLRCVQRQRVDQSHDDDGEQADDEDHRGEQEGPSRFTETPTRMPRQIGTVADVKRGKADVSAPTPAAIETATVSV